MCRTVRNLFRISVLAIVALNLGGTLFGLTMEIPLFIAAVVAFVAGFPLMSRGFQKAAVIFLALGIAMLVLGRQPAELWIKAVGSMTNVIAIVAVMQTFAVPIRIGGYDAAIKSWMEGRFRRKSSLFFFMTLTIHLLNKLFRPGRDAGLRSGRALVAGSGQPLPCCTGKRADLVPGFPAGHHPCLPWDGVFPLRRSPGSPQGKENADRAF
jgi:hypothetical protein